MFRVWFRRPSVALGLSPVLLFVAGCPNPASSTDPESGRHLSWVDTSPRMMDLAGVGDTEQIEVTGHLSDGTEADLTAAASRTSYEVLLNEGCPDAVTVDANGLVTALSDVPCETIIEIDTDMAIGGGYMPMSAPSVTVVTGADNQDGNVDVGGDGSQSDPEEGDSTEGPVAVSAVLYMQPSDPMLARIYADTGATLDVYGGRSGEGEPVAIAYVRYQTPDELNTRSATVIRFDVDGNIAEVLSNGGGRMTWDWLSADRASLTVTSTDGTVLEDGVVEFPEIILQDGQPANLPGQEKSVSAQRLSGSPESNIITVMIEECGEPLDPPIVGEAFVALFPEGQGIPDHLDANIESAIWRFVRYVPLTWYGDGQYQTEPLVLSDLDLSITEQEYCSELENLVSAPCNQNVRGRLGISCATLSAEAETESGTMCQAAEEAMKVYCSSVGGGSSDEAPNGGSICDMLTPSPGSPLFEDVRFQAFATVFSGITGSHTREARSELAASTWVYDEERPVSLYISVPEESWASYVFGATLRLWARDSVNGARYFPEGSRSLGEAQSFLAGNDGSATYSGTGDVFVPSADGSGNELGVSASGDVDISWRTIGNDFIVTLTASTELSRVGSVDGAWANLNIHINGPHVAATDVVTVDANGSVQTTSQSGTVVRDFVDLAYLSPEDREYVSRSVQFGFVNPEECAGIRPFLWSHYSANDFPVHVPGTAVMTSNDGELVCNVAGSFPQWSTVAGLYFPRDYGTPEEELPSKEVAEVTVTMKITKGEETGEEDCGHGPDTDVCARRRTLCDEAKDRVDWICLNWLGPFGCIPPEPTDVHPFCVPCVAEVEIAENICDRATESCAPCGSGG